MLGRMHFTLPLCAAIALLALPVAAAPSAKQRQEAQQLTAEAKKLAQQGELKKAVKKYKSADQLVPTVANKVELAKLLEELGDFVQSTAVLHEAVDTKPATLQDKRALSEAKKRLAEMERRTPKLDVQIFKPEASNVTLTIDDDEADAGSHPVNPGRHEIVAKANGYGDWHKTVRVDEGDSKTIEITMKASGEAGEAGEADKVTGGSARVPKWTAWTAWGATAVALGVGAGFGIMAIQTTNQVLSDYDCQAGPCPSKAMLSKLSPDQQQQLIANANADLNTAKLNGNVSTAMFVVAGACAVAAIPLTVFAFRKSKGDEADKVEARPALGPGFVGLTGAF